MNLRELLVIVTKERSCGVAGGHKFLASLPDVEVTHLTADSREVSPGSLFVAVQGETTDGHKYIEKAVSQGAVALIVNKSAQVGPQKIPVIAVDDTRIAQDFLARRFYDDPSQRMLCIGVTGTNGKTSTTYILEHILNSARVQVGVIGTINHHLGAHIWSTEHTTPEPILLQRRISEMNAEGAQALVMEVSSHALAQGRVRSLQFNIAIFTNLTLDHLDYHRTMENYFAAKQLLFSDLLWQSQKLPLFAIVNLDDKWGRKLRIAAKAGLWTYGQMFKGKSLESDFGFFADEMSFSGTHLQIETPFGTFQGDIPLCGLHNAYNVTAAVAAAAAAGISPEQSLRALGTFAGVPGRLQRVPGTDKNVFVDYAHTPDALEKVLMTLHQIRDQSATRGQIITVFGCGGDRDTSKRPVMAGIAERLSDHVILTSDNPRTEDPNAILDQIQLGFSPEGKSKIHREVDRRTAIEYAVQVCRPGDVVLIAGKGHEDYQQIGKDKLPFSDMGVVQEICGMGARP